MTAVNAGPTTIQGPQAVTGELVTGSKQPPSRFVQFKHVLDRGIEQIKMALPKHIDPIRFYRVILTAMQSPPKPGQLGILDCTQESVFSCMLTCAQLGLEPNGPQGHAYLIPFRDNNAQQVVCTLVVGFRGLIKLARNSGEIAAVNARVVHDKDRFEYQFGLHEDCIHVPTDEEDPGPVIAAYAVWRLKDGTSSFDVMTKRELDRIKNRKKLPAFSPWHSDEEEMQKKTVLRRSSKTVPNSIELTKGLEANDRQEEGLAPIPMEMSAATAPTPAIEADQEVKAISEKPKNLDEAAARAKAKREAKATPAADATSEADKKAAEEKAFGAGKTAATEAARVSPATGNVMSTRGQQKEIAELLVDRAMGAHEVVEKYGVASTSALTLAAADEAIAWLKTIAVAPEPGSEG